MTLRSGFVKSAVSEGAVVSLKSGFELIPRRQAIEEIVR
jgi:hypothetical protein